MSEKKPFSAADFLEVKMNEKLKSEPSTMSEFFCVYQFEIDQGVWNLDLTVAGPKEIKKGRHAEPDCTIKMSEENFEKLLKRKLNVPMALISGKIKIGGEKALALKLGELFS